MQTRHDYLVSDESQEFGKTYVLLKCISSQLFFYQFTCTNMLFNGSFSELHLIHESLSVYTFCI